MDSKFWTRAIVGGVVLTIGYMVLGFALSGLQDMMSGSATGVERETPLWAWMIVPILAMGALLTCVLGWAGANDPASGFKTGGLLGFLSGAGIGFSQYVFTNLNSLAGVIIGPILAFFVWGIAGAVVGMLRGKDQAA